MSGNDEREYLSLPICPNCGVSPEYYTIAIRNGPKLWMYRSRIVWYDEILSDAEVLTGLYYVWCSHCEVELYRGDWADFTRDVFIYFNNLIKRRATLKV